jgi:hypothetical protein
MANNLKNYTSTVPAATSISHIEQYLIDAGASDISKKYDDNKICKSVTFRILVHDIPTFFQIGVNAEACYKIISKQRVRHNPAAEEADRKQSERTAWKIVSDWVEIQIAMVMMDQMTLVQAFLSQVYNPAKDQTFYTQLRDNNFKQLTNG